MRRRIGVAAIAAAALLGGALMAGCSSQDPQPTALVIGDSLTVGAEMGGLGDDGTIVVDAQEGRTTATGARVAEQADLDRYEQVIVALGTNDASDTEAQFAAKIDTVMAALGPDVAVSWVNVDTGTPRLAPAATGVNAALAAAVGRHGNLEIADWDGFINGRDDADELRAGDQVHDSAEGYRVRARWMADLVRS